MYQDNRWLLPDGVGELLQEEAAQVEKWRRAMLDLYSMWGYEMVMPPLVEYLDSLLIGVGNDLQIDTVKLTDQHTGRMMGVRADITPQVARIDAHFLNRDVPVRLCYFGNVLHARVNKLSSTRAPLQIGAELYGYQGLEADFEIVQLLVKSLQIAGIDKIHLDLGHVGIFRSLVKDLDKTNEAYLFDALQRKAITDIKEILQGLDVSNDLSQALLSLSNFNGDSNIINEARNVLCKADQNVSEYLDDLLRLGDFLKTVAPEVNLHFDLAELRGYHYHTGLVFAAFLPSHGQDIAKGGRYDNIGKAFGRGRPATGFSMDLKNLLSISKTLQYEFESVWAPSEADAGLETEIAKLREQGIRVIRELPGQDGTAEQMGCRRRLMKSGGSWKVVK